MHIVWFDYFIQNIHMCKYSYLGIVLILRHTSGIIVSAPLWLRFEFLYYVTLTSSIWLNSMILQDYITQFICIYMCNLNFSCTNLHKWLSWFYFLFCKVKIILLFPCSLARAAYDINNITRVVSILVVISQVFDALIFWSLIYVKLSNACIVWCGYRHKCSYSRYRHFWFFYYSI